MGQWRAQPAIETSPKASSSSTKKASITAKDIETGVASFGDTKSEALRMLAEALELHEGGGDPGTDDDLREWGLDPDDFDTKELPEFMQ